MRRFQEGVCRVCVGGGGVQPVSHPACVDTRVGGVSRTVPGRGCGSAWDGCYRLLVGRCVCTLRVRREAHVSHVDVPWARVLPVPGVWDDAVRRQSSPWAWGRGRVGAVRDVGSPRWSPVSAPAGAGSGTPTPPQQQHSKGATGLRVSLGLGCHWAEETGTGGARDGWEGVTRPRATTPHSSSCTLGCRGACTQPTTSLPPTGCSLSLLRHVPGVPRAAPCESCSSRAGSVGAGRHWH